MTTVRQHLESALEHHRCGRLSQAADHYHCALQSEPDHPAALHMLGVLEHQRQNPAEAIRLISRAVELDPGEADYHGNLGAVLLSEGRFDEAISELRIAIGIQPAYVDARTNLARALQRSGDHERAEIAWQETLQLDDRNGSNWNAYGRLLAQLKRPRDAAQAFINAIRNGDTQAETWFLLGNALQAQEQFSEAIQAYESARKMAPGDARIHSNLGKTAKDQGNVEVALDHYQKAIELDPGLLSAHYNMGIAYMELKQGDKAATAFSTTLDLDPGFTGAIRGLARIADANDDPDAALSYLQRWHEADPDDPEPVHLLSYYSDTQTPSRAPDDYVRQQFDQFARDYDQKLERLENRGPQTLAEQLRSQLPSPDSSLLVLDAGCGTGLCGAVLRPWAASLSGVDLSPAMLEKASQRSLYDQLEEQELTAFLLDHPNSFDVIASSDTFNYFGDLHALFTAARKALRAGGWLFFNVEADKKGGNNHPYRLQRHGRYCHTEPAIRSGVEKAGLTLLELKHGVLRLESNQPVLCLNVVATTE